MNLDKMEAISHKNEQTVKPLTATIVKRDGRKMRFCLDKIAGAMQKGDPR